MRLIDADAMVEEYITKGSIYDTSDLKEMLYYMPAVDATPVVHGRWIDPAAEDCYRCSVCEEYTHMEMPRLLYHYCPNCGAKMDSERGEDDAVN